MNRSTAWIITSIVTAIFGVGFLLPLVWVVGGGFYDNGFTLRYLAAVFQNPIYVEGLFNSLKIAFGTTLLATLLSVPLAWMANRWNFFGKPIFQGLLLVPMILPPFVGAIGFQQMFGQYGAVNALFHPLLALFSDQPIDWIGNARYVGVILLQALSLYPIMYLNVAAALANIDPAMEQAAANLGCTGFARFRKITLPLIMPGLFAGGTIVFIWSFTELGTPLIMNYARCTPVQVWDALKDLGSSKFPYALVFVMLTMSIGMYILGKFVLGRGAHAMQSKAATASTVQQARGAKAFFVPLAFTAVCCVALLPHLGVFITSIATPGSWYRSVLPERFTMQNYVDALGHEMTVASIRNSLFYSSIAVVSNGIIGIALAFVIVRSKIKVRGAVDAMAMLPLAVPGIVMAFGYLAISTELSNTEMVKESAFLRQLFDVKINPTLFLVIAYAIRRLPYMVRSAVAGLQQTSVTLEEASANLGASGFYTLRRVTIPLSSPPTSSPALCWPSPSACWK